MIQWEIDFDYDDFEEQLFDASRQAFTALQEEFKDEKFYSFALVSLERFQTLGYAANSEESLQKFAEEKLNLLLQKDSKIGLTLDDIKTFYRLRIDKFVYHSSISDNFLNTLLSARQIKLDELTAVNQQYLHDSGVSMIETYLFGDMEQIFGKVMGKLDSVNTFVKTNSRENIMLELYFGGIHAIGRYETTCMLNPPIVFAEFERLVEEQKELHEKIQQLEETL